MVSFHHAPAWRHRPMIRGHQRTPRRRVCSRSDPHANAITKGHGAHPRRSRQVPYIYTNSTHHNSASNSASDAGRVPHGAPTQSEHARRRAVLHLDAPPRLDTACRNERHRTSTAVPILLGLPRYGAVRRLSGATCPRAQAEGHAASRTRLTVAAGCSRQAPQSVRLNAFRYSERAVVLPIGIPVVGNALGGEAGLPGVKLGLGCCCGGDGGYVLAAGVVLPWWLAWFRG